MRKIIWLVLALAFMQPAAADPACTVSKLSNSSGVFLRLADGRLYMVLPGHNRMAASQWLPLDKLRLCLNRGSEYFITNLSRRPPMTITVIRQY